MPVQNGILAFDTELGSVVESVYGNRKDNYIIIRAIADYKVIIVLLVFERVFVLDNRFFVTNISCNSVVNNIV